MSSAGEAAAALLAALNPQVVREASGSARTSTAVVDICGKEPSASHAPLDKQIAGAVYAAAVAIGRIKDEQLATQIATACGNAVVSGQLHTPAQLKALSAICLDIDSGKLASVPDRAALEKMCGVGAVVKPEEYVAAVAEALEKHAKEVEEKGWELQISGPMNLARAALPWGATKEIKDELDRQLTAKLGPKPAPAKKGAKGKGGGSSAASSAAAADSAALPESLPALADAAEYRTIDRIFKSWSVDPGTKVTVCGWAAHIRKQSKGCWFIDLRDGSGFLQCVLVGSVLKVRNIDDLLRRECSLVLRGEIQKVPEGKQAAGGVELHVKHWERVGASPPDLEEIVTPDSNVDTQLDQRHLVLRGPHTSSLMKMRSVVLQCFRAHLEQFDYFEVHPPTLTQSQAEGGSEIFDFDYFGEKAYLTQSSQLYLETVLPSMGKVYCCISSYRAENSRTRRHLAEYTHLESELPFISFEDLLTAIEDLVCDTAQRVHDYVARKPELQALVDAGYVTLAAVPKRPFKRLDYKDAVEYCREHEIWKDEETKTPFEFGDDIPEAPERRMTDMIGEPILMCRFPVEMKAFYMPKCKEDPRLTESVDLLMPSVGEIVGGSMRISDYDELMAAYQREGIDPSPYYWFTDQRKYGTCPHGGYGLGVERFMMWLLQSDHIRNLCMFPRYRGRCLP